MSTESATQLTYVSGFKLSNINYAPIKDEKTKDGMTNRVIDLSITNPDGTVGELIIPTEKCFSFGVCPTKKYLSTELTGGYTLPICLISRDSPTEAEKKWVDTFNSIIEAGKDHIIKNKEQFGLYDLEKSELKKMNPLYYKKENGKIVGTPTLYAKLIVSKKQNKILTSFYDENGTDIDPLSLVEKYCTVNAAIKFESILIGIKTVFRIKVYECQVKIQNSSIKKLMPRNNANKPNTQVLLSSTTQSNAPPMSNAADEDDDDDTGSIDGDNDDKTEVQQPAPTVPEPKKVVEAPKKPVVRNVVNKVGVKKP